MKATHRRGPQGQKDVIENEPTSGADWIQVIVIGLASVFVIALALAGALAWGPHHCDLVFPKVVGCALGTYETLSGGLIAAAAALIAGWLAWKAVQRQIDAEDRRAAAARVEVEQVLAADIDEFAEGLAAMWKVLDDLDWQGAMEEPPEPDPSETEAVTYGIDKIANEAWLSTSRQMVTLLGWNRRRKYQQLFDGLESLHKFRNFPPSEALSALNAVRYLSVEFEVVQPETAQYFEGFFRRAGKAWSLGQTISYIAEMSKKEKAATDRQE
jgi:hypothetical protein